MIPAAKIRIGISSCLAGEKVRYDGEHQRFSYATDILATHFTLVPVCPEVEVGMPVPRETIHLEGDPASPRVVAPGSGTDWTARMGDWSGRRVRELRAENLSGYIFKQNSPSCGVFRVKVYKDSGKMVRQGRGVFAAAFMAANPWVPVEDEDRLNDQHRRESFIIRVFAYHRLRAVLGGRWRPTVLKSFHNREQLLLQAHSRRHVRELATLVTSMSGHRPAVFREQYTALFMECLAVKATPSRQTRVLRNIVGQLHGTVTAQEHQRLMAMVQDFQAGVVPLVMPLTLLKHYAGIYQVSSLLEQSFLDPHPGELLLRNHA